MFRALLLAGSVVLAGTADARIVRLEITDTQPAFNGQKFGTVGAYVQLRGKAFGEVDPAHPGNVIIQDIQLAPRNARGMVEYTTDVEILAPADRGRQFRAADERGEPRQQAPAAGVQRRAGVLGPSYAGMRDLAAFLRDDPASPVFHQGNRTMLFGSSQSGRNMRTMLHLGFNRTEAGTRAYDAIYAPIGGGMAAMNIRFAQPGRAWGEQIDHLFPAYDFPFTYAKADDPISGRSQGMLDRCTATSTCPKIFHVATALEVWEGRQSLGLTDPLGTRDIPDPATVRTDVMASTQHGAWTAPLLRQAPFGNCQQQPNPNPQFHTMRALVTALADWLLHDAAPPASAAPRLADGTLVEPSQVRFPRIPANAYGGVERPGVKFLGVTNPLRVLDFGPRHIAADSSGIVDQEAPRVGMREYCLHVPQVDADGNDLVGIRSVTLRVPRGTYTGWNLGREDRFVDGFCSLSGSFIPFAVTRAERDAAGDPRPSIEERYASKQAYAAQVKAAPDRLVAARFLLSEDAARAAQAEETARRRGLGV